MAKRAKDKGGLEGLVAGIDRAKRAFEPGLDKFLLWGTANAGVVYGAAELIDRSDLSDSTNALIMMGTGFLIGAGNYIALKSKRTSLLRKVLGRANSALDKIRPLSWIKTGVFAALLYHCGSHLGPYVSEVAEDINSRINRQAHVEMVSRLPTSQPGKGRPDVYNNLDYNSLIEYDFSRVKLADKNSTIGRIQRTLRWLPISRAVEQKYGIPKDVLAGMIMQESYGDPVQPNAGNDGGLGVVHIQGNVAKIYGLDIHGDSHKPNDPSHGKQLKKMLEQCRYDPSRIQKYDERGHLIKVLDAAARIVAEGASKHGNWTYGVEYYRGPGHVGKNTGWRYYHAVEKWRKAINNPKSLGMAVADFEKRNGYALDDYVAKWNAMNNNWGLATYKGSG
ncbi:MAG TPA: hypothetical protein VJI46_04220 [Candidatus Nanoarchaeia archaeon]|nr:hypothetical protein [Candidatus Nanoarchaeia archaeon]